MAISVITGLMGSGKSHQAVKYIIVPNYMKGRTILTNIKGLNEAELIKYCTALHEKKHALLIKAGKPIPELTLGKISLINDKHITHPDFYPVLYDVDNNEVIDDSKSYVKSGDVVVIDEAAQFYDELTKPNLVFFTMHRHFTDEKGLTCEICLIVQNHTLLHRKLLKLVKNTYFCKKLDFFGLSGAYTLHIYDGGTTRGLCRVGGSKEKYDKDIFPIYSSYAKGQGKEEALDKRISIWKDWRTHALIAMLILVPVFIYNTAWKFFHPEKPEPKAQKANTTKSPTSSPASSSPDAQPVLVSQSPQYRIVGVIDVPGKRLIFLQDENNQIKIVYPQLCMGSGMLMTCEIENKLVSYYSPYKKKEASSYLGGYNNENKNPSNSPAIVQPNNK